jgi:hypothetical protein
MQEFSGFTKFVKAAFSQDQSSSFAIFRPIIGRHGIGAGEPAVQINIGAAFRAEGFVGFRQDGMAADGAFA